eukprot:1161821-Pelagomonas_calceolata.AAC.9
MSRGKNEALEYTHTHLAAHPQLSCPSLCSVRQSTLTATASPANPGCQAGAPLGTLLRERWSAATHPGGG